MEHAELIVVNEWNNLKDELKGFWNIFCKKFENRIH
jgi:hypothetical protein